ncbi:threonyl-tRNA synthetase, partial [Coemansia sp. RSA 486]
YEGTAWETTPMEIANYISKFLAKRLIVAKVDGELFDAMRPLEASCKLEFLDFSSEEGKKVYWHSSAHVLGEACEQHFGCNLCNDLTAEDMSYCDISIPKSFDRSVSQTDFSPLNILAKKIIIQKQRFEQLTVTKEQLLHMFSYNKYKVQLIQSKVPDNTSTTVYRCGPLIDLCRGPHVPTTGNITSFA